MGKSKKKSHSEIEFLRGEVKHLKRKLKECQKAKNREDDYDDEPVEDLTISLCESCGKGVVTELDLGIAIIRTCELCGNRETKKKKSN